MSISIERAGPQDAAAMLDAYIAAFATDALSETTFALSTASEAESTEFRDWREDVTRLRMIGPGKHYFKAVDDTTGFIAGYAGFYDSDADPPVQSLIPAPARMNREVSDEVRVKLARAKLELLGWRKDCRCESCHRCNSLV